MNKFLEILFVFIIGCTFGWILELIYRSYKTKKLVNPGFLMGCALPLYGYGWVVLYLLCSIDYSFIGNKIWQVVFLIAICSILMTLIEYLTGLFCLKVLKTRYWDYSDRKFNIQGIICPMFSFVWALCSLGFYFLIFPWLGTAAKYASNSVVMILIMGAYYGVFIVDTVYSLGLVSKLRNYAVKFKEQINFENLKHSISEKYQTKKGKNSNTFSFRLYSRISKFIDEHKPSKNDNASANSDKPVTANKNVENKKEQ